MLLDDAKRLFEESLPLVHSIVCLACRRRTLSAEDEEEFRSYVHLKLIENDYRIFRRFENRSAPKTYLTVVVQRLLLDFLDKKWGRWRASVAAKRLGPVAMRLEELMARDGFNFDEAAKTIEMNERVGTSRDELFRIAQQLPARAVRRPRPYHEIPFTPAISSKEAHAERDIRLAEANRIAKSAESVFASALKRLRAQDRLILKMRFRDGLTVPEIASTLNLESKALYRRLDKSLKHMRKCFLERGFTFAEIVEAIEWGELSIVVDSEIL